MFNSDNRMKWLSNLKNHTRLHPIVVLRISDSEWLGLRKSRRGTNEFTLIRPHSVLEKVKALTPSLIIGGSGDAQEIHFGLITSKQGVATLDSRIKVKRSSKLHLKNEEELKGLVQDSKYKATIGKWHGNNPAENTSNAFSHYLIDQIYSDPENSQALRLVADRLMVPKKFDGSNIAYQEDAVHTALRAFGLEPNADAAILELVSNDSSALSRVSMIEDAVIEHDSRSISGWSLTSSEITGKARFEKRGEVLEVITANRRALESCLGVDLIYLNQSRKSIATLQYKMLEFETNSESDDWVYRPNTQFQKEISRMKKFASDSLGAGDSYRLNPSALYLKFVKRNALLQSGSIITPLDHYEQLAQTDVLKGPRGGLRVSYEALGGNYMRPHTFQELLQSGYIGTYPPATKALELLIRGIIDGNRAIVFAIQSGTSKRTISDDIHDSTFYDDMLPF